MNPIKVKERGPVFIQIEVGGWTNDEGREGFCVIGLTKDGQVLQYYKSMAAWVPFNNTVLKRGDDD